MALASTGFWCVVEICDNGNNRTEKRYQMVAEDATQAALDMVDILAAINSVTAGVITSEYFYERFVEDALSYPASGVEIQNQALLDFDIVDHPEKTATLTIPAPEASLFVATSGSGANILDTADADVILFRDLFRTGGQLLLSDGEVAESLVKGRRIHRKSNNG